MDRTRPFALASTTAIDLAADRSREGEPIFSHDDELQYEVEDPDPRFAKML